MKKLIAGLGVMLGLACAAVPAKAPERLLVILTSAEVETQAMTLVLSNQAAARGASVHLLLCGPAGDIATRNPPAAAATVVTPRGMTVSSLLGGLMAKGATVDVCAIYLPNRKLGRDALAANVGVASPPEIAAEMLAEDTRLFTF